VFPCFAVFQSVLPNRSFLSLLVNRGCTIPVDVFLAGAGKACSTILSSRGGVIWGYLVALFVVGTYHVAITVDFIKGWEANLFFREELGLQKFVFPLRACSVALGVMRVINDEMVLLSWKIHFVSKARCTCRWFVHPGTVVAARYRVVERFLFQVVRHCDDLVFWSFIFCHRVVIVGKSLILFPFFSVSFKIEINVKMIGFTFLFVFERKFRISKKTKQMFHFLLMCFFLRKKFRF